MDDKKQFYEVLKSKREAGNFSLDEISDFTKIDIKYLLAIEEGNFSYLPAVYMRLFLRSYCRYIGEDSKKALNDYEFFTVGIKPKETTDKDVIQDTTKNTNEPDEENLNIGQIPTTKVITIIATVLSLFLIFYIINSISNKNNEPDVTPEISNQVTDNVEPATVVESYLELPNKIKLSETEFAPENFIKESSHLLPDMPPYELIIIPHAETKINISNDNISTNTIVQKDEVLKFNIQDVIRFDIWSANHVTCKLNGTVLNTFFGSEEQSIRGSFVASEQKLWYGVYKQITY